MKGDAWLYQRCKKDLYTMTVLHLQELDVFWDTPLISWRMSLRKGRWLKAGLRIYTLYTI